MSEKWPRHYASEILDIPTRAARAAHLETVPDHLRDLVRRHVEDHFNKVRGYKRHCLYNKTVFHKIHIIVNNRLIKSTTQRKERKHK